MLPKLQSEIDMEKQLADAQATIADLQGQIAVERANKESAVACVDRDVKKISALQQRVAQLEGERDEATKGHTALLQAMANWIARLKPDHHPMYRRGVEEVIAATFNGVDLDSTPVLVSDWQKQQIRLATLQADHARVLGLVRALQSECWKEHVPVTGTQHDPANGLIHGYCARCRRDWPCEWSPESISASLPAQGGAVSKPVTTCNRHSDCDAADEKARAKGALNADHCHDDCCSECFGN